MSTGHASIDTWQAYFHTVDLYIADIDTVCAATVQSFLPNKILIGDQNSEKDLMRWIQESGGNFDVIVDDGSHISQHQMESFRVLFEHGLKPGGLYFLEDSESPDRKLCDSFQPDTLSRDWVVYLADQLLKFPTSAHVDIPKGLQSITIQREMAVFKKCGEDEPRCLS